MIDPFNIPIGQPPPIFPQEALKRQELHDLHKNIMIYLTMLIS